MSRTGCSRCFGLFDDETSGCDCRTPAIAIDRIITDADDAMRDAIAADMFAAATVRPVITGDEALRLARDGEKLRREYRRRVEAMWSIDRNDRQVCCRPQQRRAHRDGDVVRFYGFRSCGDCGLAMSGGGFWSSGKILCHRCISTWPDDPDTLCDH